MTSKRLSVETPSAMAAIRGTDWSLEVTPDDPDHALNAVRTAQDMLAAIGPINEALREDTPPASDDATGDAVHRLVILVGGEVVEHQHGRAVAREIMFQHQPHDFQ